jgi:hypothetical protein
MGAPTDVVTARPGDDDAGGHVDGVTPAPQVRPGTARDPWWTKLDDWLGLAILVACCVYIFIQLQPHQLLRDTTASGGDTGAHVWWPAYLRDHLLPWRLAGWSPDFYAGFPAGQYYFPVPALMIIGLDLVIPYNVAFKLITGLGPVLLPIGAYVFARGLRAPKPTPAAFAVASTALLFFTGDPGSSTAATTIAFNQRIMGGTLASTFAGEYSFTIAVAFALLFFGTFAIALRTRRRLWLPAVLLAACLMSHLVVGILALFGAFAVWVFQHPLKSATRAMSIGAVGFLLSAVWSIPLIATLSYTTNMRYGTIGEPVSTCKTVSPGQCYPDYLFPKYFFDPGGWEPYRWGAYILIGIAIIAAVGFLRRSTFTVLVLTALSGLAFRFWSELGSHVWNLRLLSFWYLGIHLLMGIGAAELIRGAGWLAGRGWRWARESPLFTDEPEPPPSIAGDDDRADDDGVLTSPPPPPPVPVPAARPRDRRNEQRLVALVVMLSLTAVLAVGALVSIDHGKNFLPYWAKWNYSGYQNVENEINGSFTQPCSAQGTIVSSLPTEPGEDALCVFQKTTAIGKQWPEYHALMQALAKLPPGRSLAEGGPSLDKYGTPLALMLIPYWTKGRITTMEGVYFEASATTPYLFETVAALVAAGENSNPVRGIPYRDYNSFSQGVQYLQSLGVNYFLVHNPETKRRADADPRLRLVAFTRDKDATAPLGWNVYRVMDAPLVQGLGYEPVVADGVSPDPNGWEQRIAVPWWWYSDQLDKPVVASGLSSWRHAAGSAALRLPRRAIAEPAKVTNVRTTDSSVSFDVDRIGKPVLVKTSYFPNWRASGAEGPYRATPNFMVVVPTQKHVTLHYGTTHVEWLGRFLTLVGLVGVGLLVWWGRRRGRAAPAPAGTMSSPSRR